MTALLSIGELSARAGLPVRLEIAPAFEARMRSSAPALPDDPSPQQVDAWIELAELVQDADFRARIRSMSEHHASSPPAGDMQAAAALVSSRAGDALAAGVEPGSAAAESVVAEILPAFGNEDRLALADRLRRARRALLAAARDRQRLAAGPDYGPRVGVADRRAARVRRLASA